MIIREIDEYFMKQSEPEKSVLLALSQHLRSFDAYISEEWKHKMPFYYFKGKMFCYLWTKKPYNLPYIGFVDGRHLDHADLIIEKRSRMKILMIDPLKNIPIRTINSILREAIKLRQGAYRFRSPLTK